MNAEQFTVWLHGFFEISGAKTLNEKQVQIVKDHLALLFDKVTPDRNKGITTPTPLLIPALIPDYPTVVYDKDSENPLPDLLPKTYCTTNNTASSVHKEKPVC